MSINKRVKKILERKRYSNSAFEKKNGLANGTIRKITIEENFNPSYKVMNAFAVTFPDLNLRWLITGKGEMLFNSFIEDSGMGYDKLSSESDSESKIASIKKDLEYASAGMRANKNKIREMEKEIEKLYDKLVSLDKDHQLD